MKKQIIAGVTLLDDENLKKVFHPVLWEYSPFLILVISSFSAAAYAYYYNWYAEFYTSSMFVGLGVFVSILILLNIFTNTFFITDDRIVYVKGLFDIEIIEVFISKITDIRIDQSLFERLLNFGDVSIDTAGGAGYEIVMKGVSGPKSLQLLIKNLTLKKEREH